MKSTGKLEAGVSGDEVFQKITGTDALLSQTETFSSVKSNQIAQVFNLMDNIGVEKANMYAYVKAAYLSELFQASSERGYAARLLLWIRKYFAFTEKFSGALVFALLLDYFINSNTEATGFFLLLIHFQMIFMAIFSLTTVPYLIKSYRKASAIYNDEKYRSSGVKCAFLILHFSHFFRAWGTYLQIGTVIRWLFKND